MSLDKMLAMAFSIIIILYSIESYKDLIHELSFEVFPAAWILLGLIAAVAFVAWKRVKNTIIISARNENMLASVSSQVMMADVDFNIVYANPTVIKMLKEAEADIRKDLPNFSVDKLIGTNIDGFHKNPAHQRGMAKSLDGTYETTITVGGRIFDLIANPVSHAGLRMGTVVEWQDVTQIRANETKAARIQTSLDCVTSNVMLADENNIISYMNPSVVEMMKEAEEDIRKDLPKFDTTKLIGTCIDDFHKNPAHQQMMLEKLEGTYKTSITVGGRIFDLVANPVNDAEGGRIGTVVEWQDVTKTRAIEARGARIQTSLDNVTSNVMLADENNIVIYMNDAVTNMLKAAENDIRQVLPKFDVDEVVGGSIDRFHKDPSHQIGMLKHLSSTYRTSIKVGSRTFSLIANPVMGENDERLGTVVEWSDITQELAIEDEVNNVVEATTQGDFTQRLGTEGKEGFMLKLANGINKIGEVSQVGLTETVDVLEGLSQGNLTKLIEGEYQGTFDDIKRSLNATITQLQTTVGTIKQSASSVNSASSEISAGSKDLSERTEQQASTLEETAASMEELTGAVRQNTDNASNANGLADGAKEVAAKGGEVVKDAVTAMGGITESSQKIADIITVIDDIAFQTNLLALNAAVEAARAGDAGKGFAVVASEVRSLAGRSAAASKDIKALINESSDQVKSGSELVNQAGDTLEEIVSSVTEVAGLISEIASASTQQATGLEEINSAVSQMDEMTQQNAALVEENTAAAQSMVDQAYELEDLMKFFRIDENDEVAARPAAKKAAPVAKPSAPAAKPATPKPSSAASTDDEWEEF